jgi:glucokinase
LASGQTVGVQTDVEAPLRGGHAAPQLAVGLDVGGTKILGVALDPQGQILAEARRDTPSELSALVGQLANLADALAREVGEEGPIALGLGIPALVHHGRQLGSAPNLPAVAGADIVPMVSEALEERDESVGWIVVENDATAATWAEHCLGAGQGAGDLVMVTLGTGIGGGIVAGGKIQRGAAGLAGEIGHMVVDPAGPECPCGRRGCWEQMASGNALGRFGREVAQAGSSPALLARLEETGTVRGEDVVAAAAAGDEGARAVLETHRDWMALGIANLVEILDPGIVVLGGGLIRQATELVPALAERVPRLLRRGERLAQPEIAAAVLGERTGALGCALLAMDAAGLDLQP